MPPRRDQKCRSSPCCTCTAFPALTSFQLPSQLAIRRQAVAVLLAPTDNDFLSPRRSLFTSAVCLAAASANCHGIRSEASWALRSFLGSMTRRARPLSSRRRRRGPHGILQRSRRHFLQRASCILPFTLCGSALAVESRALTDRIWIFLSSGVIIYNKWILDRFREWSCLVERRAKLTS